MSEGCPPGCRAGSALFSRVTLIILGVVAVWLFVTGILEAIVLNQMPAGDKTSLSNATFALSIVQIIVGFLVLLFVGYAILAPQGTLKEYIIPYLESRGDTGVGKLRRSSA